MTPTHDTPTRCIGNITYTHFRTLPPLSSAPLVYVDAHGIWAAHPAIEAWWREQEFYVMLAMVAADCRQGEVQEARAA